MTLWIWQQPNWPQFKWHESELFQLLVNARHYQGKLLGTSLMLDQGLTLEAQAEILIDDGINTSAIEGEQINLEAIRSSVSRHLGLPTQIGATKTPRAVEGLVEVLLDATNNYETPMSMQRLYGWQAALFPTGYSGLFKIKTGELRGAEPMQVVSGPVGREKIHFEAPSHTSLAEQLQEFIAWFNAPPTTLDGLLRAGIAHLWFVTLHPFEDGNGRIARAITDMAIAQDEKCRTRLFSLSAQIMKNREEYYDILEKTQRGELEITDWLRWFLQQVTGACQLAELTIDRILEKAHFWLQHKNTALNERQRKVINRLLDAGQTGFTGGLNTRKYMSLTKTSRATAYRELHDLVEKKCIERIGDGRSAGYILRIKS